ncbi:hypothetical protein EDB81DRAFT_948217 [Dactylonectria macrodidyma]|uniref:FAD-binding PCMH-type domain-containing protein n=1 Tax=Dactylonectria macrodidyma TaxID=307937 RepID=A0A9P9ELY5_9HYPO|nr:hypothetical protein EDB81DRAFT_948217 [Dactylonectria macrodidyma]
MLPRSAYPLLALGFVATASTATDPVLETSQFNITEALLEHGVDVSEIPALDGGLKRSDNACAIACASLKFLYGDEAVETKDETAYEVFLASFWSAIQGDVSPQCIFKPSKKAQVSVAVLLSRLTQCPFAAKSGGHAAFAGASVAEGGITISFANLKAVTLSKDKKIASIEPGNIWGDVYAELAESDLTVIGGRLYNIGVGGLTTGGGVSYFSNLYGWACDNVESYEVVLANGEIVKATAKKHSDLYWALRGGGNNFGLVVGFNLKTYSLPNGELWGGGRTYTEESFPALTDAVVNLINNSPNDPKAGFWSVWAYFNKTKIALPTLYYAEPDGGDAAIWDDFNALEAVSDTTQTRHISEYAKEGMDGVPNGLREMYYSITAKVDRQLLQFAQDLYFETVVDVADIPGILPTLVVQGITIPQLKKMEQNGGNPLGIKADDGPFFLILMGVMWADNADDDVVFHWVSDFIKGVDAEAKRRGLDNDYIYMNYASQYQDVISSYGDENKAKLKKIANKYDPKQVYQRLQPGYFKLDRAPVPDLV